MVSVRIELTRVAPWELKSHALTTRPRYLASAKADNVLLCCFPAPLMFIVSPLVWTQMSLLVLNLPVAVWLILKGQLSIKRNLIDNDRQLWKKFCRLLPYSYIAYSFFGLTYTLSLGTSIGLIGSSKKEARIPCLPDCLPCSPFCATKLFSRPSCCWRRNGCCC